MVAQEVEVFAEMELFHAINILLDSDGGGKQPGNKSAPPVANEAAKMRANSKIGGVLRRLHHLLKLSPVTACRQTAADRIQNGGALPSRRYVPSVNHQPRRLSP